MTTTTVKKKRKPRVLTDTSNMGRPKVDPIRKKQIRFARIEDELLKLTEELCNEEDKEKILAVLEKLKEPGKRKCS